MEALLLVEYGQQKPNVKKWPFVRLDHKISEQSVENKVQKCCLQEQHFLA